MKNARRSGTPFSAFGAEEIMVFARKF